MKDLNEVSVYNEFSEIRRRFHSLPELSGAEKKTAYEIVEILKQFPSFRLYENIGGAGVLAVYDSKKKGKAILIRAELDALPIQEHNKFRHRSKANGVAHMCGHDGHLTILLALAKQISERPVAKGKVFLLFQPAEEDGRGAQAILNDPQFDAFKFDYVFALHNLPGYPLKQIIVKKGAFTAAVKSLIIRLNGKTAHAAEPENGINPAMAISEILQKTSQLSNNAPNSKTFSVITPVRVNMGELAYGVSAGYGEIHFTIRTWTEAGLTKLSKKITQMVMTIAHKQKLKVQIEWDYHFRANENNAAAVNFIRKAGIENGFDVVEQKQPFKWGEDFGLFTQQFKGAMFGIGSGENCPALHNPDYDFPDEIIPTAVQLFYSTLNKALEE